MEFFLCALLLATASVMSHAKDVSFDKCGHASFEPLHVSVEPYPPKIGGDLKIVFSGPGDIHADGGTFSYKASIRVTTYLFETWVELDNGGGDICDYTDCPIKPGDITVQYTQNLPPVMPPGKYKVEVKAEDLNKDELMCVVVKVDISASNMEEGGGWDVHDIPVLLDPYPMEV